MASVLKRVLVGVICVPLVVLLILLAPVWALAVVLAVVCALVAWEFLHSTSPDMPRRLHIYAMLCALAIPLGFLPNAYFGIRVVTVCAVALLIVDFAEAIFTYQRSRPVTADMVLKSLFAGVFLPGFLATLVVLRNYGFTGHGRMYVMLTIGLAFLTDAGAYFVGMLFGKHRGITKVSPNKSVEGFLGGLAVGILFALVFGVVLQYGLGFPVSYPALAVYGLLGAVVTEVGDLAFSLIKREYGVKDYGKLLPGHGGMLDRLDSTVFCAPVVLLLSMCWAAF